MIPGGPSVVALGGGHGLATTLAAARGYAGRLTAVVSVADDGGSSGELRRIAGIPAPGDLRRCLVAMAEPGSKWAAAFEYRFPAGELQGHALGNLLITGLADATGDFAEALEMASSLVGPVGPVLPATAVPVVLRADVGGKEVLGQVNVSRSPGPISSVSLLPDDAPPGAGVVEAIGGADQVVIGPGSLFTSVLATCVVPGVLAALRERTRARRVYVCNLRPQSPETSGFSPLDHLEAVLSHGVPVDVMVVPGGPGEVGGLVGPGAPSGVEVVVGPVSLPGGGGHDPVRLAAVLRELT